MESLSSLNKIRSYLTAIETNVKLSNIDGYYDINRKLEDIIARLLNLIYGYKFINANRIESNFPAVDLIDDDNRIAVQVTSDNSYTKINKTFDVFFNSNKKLFDKYDTVKFFMLKGKMEKYDIKKIPFKTKGFNVDEDILDNENLLRMISDFKIEQLQVIEQFLEKEFVTKIVTKLEDINKLNYKIDCSKYISRYVVKRNGANQNKEKLIDVFDKENKIVLLSEAGEGKTIELLNLIANINNTEKKKFPFYQRLNEYVDEDIEDLIPKEYKMVYLDNLIFVLDAYDEIEEKNKKTFVRKLEKFCNNNENIKVIVTSRKNFYTNKSLNVEGTFSNFSEYVLAPLDKNDINEILVNNHILQEGFWEEIKKQFLGNYIYNPFYLNEIIEIYLKENKIPSNQELMDNMIEKSYLLDINKYKNTLDLENEKNELDRLLKIIALTLEMLGKNYLSNDEYVELICNGENRNLLKFSSIWNKDNNWSFKHNNFGEYLAAKKMSEYSLEEIKNIVTYENVQNKIKPTWINTITFLVNKYMDNNLIEWVITCMPEFIVYIEEGLVDFNTKKKILRLLVDKYNKEKIWFPYSIRNKNLINDKNDLEFLLTIIKENNHYTSVGNALYMIENSENLYNQEYEIKDVLLTVAKGNMYSSYNKSVAIELLANFKLGTYEDLQEIIKFNKHEEKSILRKSYYYYCNKLGMTNKMIDEVIERLDVSRELYSRNSDDDLYSWEENEEYYKIFNNINEVTALNKAIKCLDNVEFSNYSDGDKLIISICNSVFNTYKDENEILNNLLTIYLKVEEQYSTINAKIIVKTLKEKCLLLNFFKKYLNTDQKRGCRMYENIIDDECMKFYYEEYKNNKYDDDITEEILRFCNTKIEYYDKLKEIYEIRTGKKFEINIPKDYTKIRKDSILFFIDKIFNKKEFICLTENFISDYGCDGKIKLEYLKDLKHSEQIENDIRYKELLYFLCWNFRECDEISIDLIEKWYWNNVVLGELYRKLSEDSEIILSDAQIKILKKICEEEVKYVNFRKALYNHRINRKCLYLWFFRNKFDFTYPENVLLDMLEFEFSNSGKRVGFGYISKYVKEEKIKERVIENLNKTNLFWQVFENHIDYCIEKNIHCCVENVGKYLMNKKYSELERIKAAQYMIKYMKLENFVNNYFYKLEFKMQKHIVDEIIQKNEEILYIKFCEKLKKSRKIEYKIFYSQKLIAMNKKEGLESYYNFIKKEKAPYRDSVSLNSINKEISKIKDIKMLDILIRMLDIILDPSFKDDTFDGIYTNVRSAIINVMVENIDNFSIIKDKLKCLFKKYEKYNKVGMISYLIVDLEEEYCRKCSKKYSIYEVKKIIKELDEKSDIIKNWV